MSQGGKQAFEKKISEIEALRSADPATAVAPLRKALKDRANYLVSKAAAVAGALRAEELIPDLIAAFDRFLKDPVKSDPQCWAKTAVVKALKDLGHRDPDVFLKGIDHIQLEPVYGGKADSAATLRGACALALIDCRMDDLLILSRLADRLADPETPVRLDAALAIGQFGRDEGALLLRLKALLGDREPEVTGQCFNSLMAIAPRDSLAFIRRFLENTDEAVVAEAAGVLATSREPEAIEILKTFWKTRAPIEARKAILISLGASTMREAAEFLLAVLAQESSELASQALRALAASRFHRDMQAQIQAALKEKQDDELNRIFENQFPREP
ncbi:MAG: HEAT repeat domain-containing protein [Bryobacterales bacterium]|nr:HEAT repeat domain-containing protein [Bryobacterales bacterium]MBV9399762.1 HEAT repeat domain-containing protein [Bryobacterales bacterium]